MPLADDFHKIVTEVSSYYKGVSEAPEKHKLIYDSSSETLEPIYFWVLDMMSSMVGKPEKIVDNFTSSPGSGHFSELMGKATKMQEEAMKIMQTTGILIKSMINIIYDLKEFEIRLSQYKAANSKNKSEAEAGLLSLKQIWMDNVDIKRGAGSINALATGQLNFVTLRDAFMMANSLEDITKKPEDGGLDLNDRVKRILEARLSEFLKWRDLSERELRKRYDIEKTYLKSQLNSLKLYTRWAKPYLRAATQLEQPESKDAGLVTAFNTIIFELALLSSGKFNFQQAAVNKKIPYQFKDMKLKRDYYSCVIVDFYFRGIPQRVGTNYVFGGRAEVTFQAYALNQEEMDRVKSKMEKQDMKDALALVSGMTDESIKSLQEDIDYFLKDEEQKEKDAKNESSDANPFLALFGFGKKKEEKKDNKKDKTEEDKPIKPDSYKEKLARTLAEQGAREACFAIFDIYKKAHGMASHPHDEYEPANVQVWQKGKTFFGWQ